MLVSELIDRLSDYPPNAKVRLMVQPHYPFEHDIDGLWESAPQPDACGGCGQTQDAPIHDDRNVHGHDYEDYDPTRFGPEGETPEGVVFILEGGQRGYGTKKAWSECDY